MYEIRPYRPEDLAGCVQCFYEGFFNCPVQPQDMAFIQDYTQVLIEKCNFTLVALAQGKVVGYISGGYQKAFSPSLAKQHSPKPHYGLFIKIFVKYYLKRYAMSGPFKAEYDIFFAKVQERKSDTLGPCDCELVTLTSRKGYRKGLGTALVNAFLAHCRSNNVKTVRLVTTSDVSYSFYDKYGFTRVKDLPFTGKGLNGATYVYEYRL